MLEYVWYILLVFNFKNKSFWKQNDFQEERNEVFRWK